MGDGFLDVLYARDVACGGVGVHVPHGFKGCDLDQEVELIVSLPGSRSFCVSGRIRHSTTFRDETFFGVEFTNLASADRDKLKRYVKERQREEDS